MPLWQIFTPKNAFTPEEKRDLANRITDIYSGPESDESIAMTLPRFYTTTVFQEFDAEDFFVGGEPRDQFIQIEVVHIARTNEGIAARMGLSVEEFFVRFFAQVDKALKPYIADRGYECEFHVENAPHITWKIDGLTPPPEYSEAELRWANDNKSSPYQIAVPAAP